MRLWKQIAILILLTVSTACNYNAKFTFNTNSEMTHLLREKQMPTKHTIKPIENIKTKAKSAILINALTGEVLFDKNINQSFPVASMSKIMTELIVLEAIEQGTLQWSDTVTISDYAYLISHQPGYASVELQQNTAYLIQDLFKAMAIRSANGATIALAEAVAGSEKEFVKLMNEKAEQLNLDNSYFVNSTGLTNVHLLNHHSTGTLEDSNLMSATDLATLTQYILKEFPALLETTQLHSFEFSDVEFMNSNWMLPNFQNDFTNEDLTFFGVDGLKTGFTSDAGYGFTGTVLINDLRFISVIIGTEEIMDRFVDTKNLYNKLFIQLEE